MQLVDEIQKDYLKDDIPDFDVGDTIQVHVIISEGGAKRTQRFEGYVTARKGSGLDETFTVRKMVQGEGVERVFPLHSPRIDRIEKVRSGRVRRSKLYYLSEQKGKAAEIREELEGEEELEEDETRTAQTDEEETEPEEAEDAELQEQETKTQDTEPPEATEFESDDEDARGEDEKDEFPSPEDEEEPEEKE